MLQVGQEWFHKKTLIPVAITAMGYAYVAVKSSIGPAFDVLKSELSEHYARNEPVTLELLDRMGWDVSRYSAGSAILELTKTLTYEKNGYNGMSLIWRPEDQPPRGFHLNLSLVRWECSAIACEKPLAAAHTLRDLLNVLRLFGVKDSVTPAAS